ncbi:unnamed protein product [Sphagnum troendelagicum]
MSSNGDPVVSVVVAEDVAVVVAFDDSDGDMQATVHSVAKSKQKRQKHHFRGSMSRIGRMAILLSIVESASARCVASGTSD